MDLVVIVLALVLLALSVESILRRLRKPPRSWLDEHVAKTLVVHRRGEDPIAGLLVSLYRDAVVLRHASVIVGNGERVPLAGDVVIPRAFVVLVQYDDDVSIAELDERPAVPVRIQ